MPNGSLRMNGPYTTAPETCAATNSNPMPPRNTVPGSPARRLACSRNIRAMNPVSMSGSSRSTAPVRASNLTEAVVASGFVAFPMTICTTCGSSGG